MGPRISAPTEGFSRKVILISQRHSNYSTVRDTTINTTTAEAQMGTKLLGVTPRILKSDLSIVTFLNVAFQLIVGQLTDTEVPYPARRMVSLVSDGIQTIPITLAQPGD